MRGDEGSRYVVDTHPLLWHLSDPPKLSAAARGIFHLVRAGLAEMWVPAIVLAELDYACRKYRLPPLTKRLFEHAVLSSNFRFAPLDDVTFAIFLEIQAPLEMHDRLVAADALRRRAPIITRDRELRDAEFVETIW